MRQGEGARPLWDEVALEELRPCAGRQFDPHVVDAFCAAIGGRAADTALG